MERRDFLSQAGLLSALALLPTPGFAAEQPAAPEDIKPFLLPAQAPLDHKGGMDIRVWVRSSMTGGLYSSVETAVAPKLMGPPPHYHEALDELMYVVEGTASLLQGDEVVQVQAGGWHMRPRKLKHTFFNASDKPLRFIDMYFNQPFEEYLEQIFKVMTPANGYVDGTEKKMKAMNDLNTRFGVIFPPDAFKQMDSIKKEYGLH
ncbi:cupin domain-containing protein [Nostoc sp. NIES-2111]